MVHTVSCQSSANCNINDNVLEGLLFLSLTFEAMAAAVALPGNEFFSESYMDAFYKAHVASSRTRGSGNLDEDIAAIEAEIRK